MRSKILQIAGDASFRKFYRVTFNKNSKIIVFAEKEKYKNLIAYSTINNFLRVNKILAPKLYNYNFSKNFIIIEYFGNLSFYKLLLKKKNKFTLYKKLVDLLIKIQKIKPKSKIKNIKKGFHYVPQYSNKYLFEESNLFFDWYLPLFLNKKKAYEIKAKSKKILKKLYNKLNFSNSCFVHRDYHAQNLMMVGKKIGVIDSHVALIGNPSYDLVSLIDDVRIKTPRKLKKQIYNYYLKKTLSSHRDNSKKFMEDFNILSVQRALKIIGIFSRLSQKDQKNQYLKFIPYTWKILETRMNSKIFSELRNILDKNITKKFRKIVYK